MTPSPLQSALRDAVEKYFPAESPYFEMSIGPCFVDEACEKQGLIIPILAPLPAHRIGIIAAVAAAHWRARANQIVRDTPERLTDECKENDEYAKCFDAIDAWQSLYEMAIQQARVAGK